MVALIISRIGTHIITESGRSFSAGFTELSISELSQMTKEEIVDKVDGYLYQAKQAGKRRFVSDNLLVLL